MRSRPNARRMSSIEDEPSRLFREEEPLVVKMRRRPVPRTQMGDPVPRVGGDKRRPVVEWTKAILICLALVSGFLTFTWFRRSRHLQRKSADFIKLDRCDLRTYPLWQIGQLKELNLSGCEHINIPDDSELWSRFTSLKKLDLNNNYLSDLPEALGALSPSLEILFLSENKFESIPEVIGKLSRLRVLSLRGNSLRELSTSNMPITSLVWLILTNNRIGRIDTNVSDLKFLRKLMLSHNEIASVPVELGECKDLELIRLSNNKLKSMPKEVITLPKLAWISLSGNPMSIPPKAVEKVIKESDIEMQSKILGKGASGTVYKAKYDGKDVAVKVFKEKSKGSDGNAADEAAINGLINHPLAVSAIGVIPLEGDDGYKGMVMNLLDGTYPLGKVPSFETVTRNEGPAPHSENMSNEQVLSAVWNIASVLEYIHSSVGVSHSDVYLHNVLRDGHFVARLSDWGASFIYDRKDSDSAAIFERIEVLAFGRLVQSLFDWHLNIAVPDSTEPPKYLGKNRKGRMMDEGPLKELIASVLKPDQANRPKFSLIKEKLESMPEFKEFVDS